MTPPRRSLPSVPRDRRGALSQTAPSSTEKHQKSVREKYECIDSSATDSDLLTRTHIYRSLDRTLLQSSTLRAPEFSGAWIQDSEKKQCSEIKIERKRTQISEAPA